MYPVSLANRCYIFNALYFNTLVFLKSVAYCMQEYHESFKGLSAQNRENMTPPLPCPQNVHTGSPSSPPNPCGRTINLEKSEVFSHQKCGRPHQKNSPMSAKSPHWTNLFPLATVVFMNSA